MRKKFYGQSIKELYVLHYCDAWKSRVSMRIACIATSRRRFKNAVRKAILSGDMTYDAGGYSSTREQAAAFLQDWKTQDVNFIDSRLKYGRIETIPNGELQ